MSDTNRWADEVGMGGYGEIMALSPAHGPLRHVVAKELARRHNESNYVVDLGAGTGDSALPIARFVNRPIILIDEDISALNTARARFQQLCLGSSECGDFSRLRFGQNDLLAYLNKASRDVDGVPALTSSWTIHNFSPGMRKKIFEATAGYLRQLEGKHFILMDKIYPDGPEYVRVEMLNAAFRLFGYLSDKSLLQRMIDHARADFAIRMLEGQTISLLEDFGFNVMIGPRVERDLVLICELMD